MEQFPQLITRWEAQTVGVVNPAPNPAPNPVPNAPSLNANVNIQMIVTKPREPNVAVVTRGGAATGADQAMQIEPAAQARPQVRPAA